MTHWNRWSCCAVLASLLLAGSAGADPLTYQSFVGSWNNFNSFGELGFVHDLAKVNHVADGNFGARFDNIVTVNSITIDQRNDAGRHRMRDLRVYTSPTTFTTASLIDSQDSQTIPLSGLTSDYFLITVQSYYDVGAVDNNPGITAFAFDGTLGAARNNLNGVGNVTGDPTITNYFDPPSFFLDVLNNGQAISKTGGIEDGIYFEHADTTDRSIQFTYNSAQTVASVGLAFEGQQAFSYNTRPIPKFVTVTDSNGNTQNVTLSPNTLQYGQYELATPFTNTTSLKVTLPVGVENYWPVQIFDPQQPQSTLTGIVEFQAFADSILPPPTSADFDGDDDVDGQDFLIWQRGVGVGTLPAQGDANGDGAVNGADLDVWKQQFAVASAPVAGAVPEPAAAALLASAALVGLLGRRRVARPRSSAGRGESPDRSAPQPRPARTWACHPGVSYCLRTDS
jgi:hypothetical protein